MHLYLTPHTSLLTPHTSLLHNSLQLFMIPEVREGVVQFDQCAELFEDPEDDDEKPLLPAGPANRKDEPIEVRRHSSTSCPSMGPPPHPTSFHASPHNVSVVMHSTKFTCDSCGLLSCPAPRAPPSPPPPLRTRLTARTATDES